MHILQCRGGLANMSSLYVLHPFTEGQKAGYISKEIYISIKGVQKIPSGKAVMYFVSTSQTAFTSLCNFMFCYVSYIISLTSLPEKTISALFRLN